MVLRFPQSSTNNLRWICSELDRQLSFRSSFVRNGLVVLLGALSNFPASAETLQPFFGASIVHDDNLLRLSSDRAGLNGYSADTYRSIVAGLKIARPIGRQSLSGMAKYSSVKFQRNGQLDYMGKDLSADWQWVLGTRLDGRIGASYQEVLAPFADFHSDQRNLRISKKQYADGGWRFHSKWKLRAGYTKDQLSYELPSQRANARTEESAMSGLDYLATSGSTIGFQFRRLTGNYPGRRSFDTSSFIDGYVQEEAKLNVLWLATGNTQVSFLGGWVQRKQHSDVHRVDRGTNARLIVDWAPTSRVKLVGQTWREFAAIEGALVDDALNTGFSARATWDLSEKTQTVLDLKHERRDFSPSTKAGNMLPSASLTDSNNKVSVGWVYKPLRTLSLKLAVFREQRSGSAAAGTNSYNANGASFDVSTQF